jgi:monofunctional glycosyltransferase
MKLWHNHLLRGLALCLISAVALQLAFVARVALMRVVDPQSTAFQRSEAARLLGEGRLAWSQQWVDGAALSPALYRAVIASEDGGFFDHRGVDWRSLEEAWEKNQRAAERAERRRTSARVVGGSTITQQLAKNLFLSGERTVLRKGQELFITGALELLLPKTRILEIYLNSVEWGEGIFGAEAAAEFYFRGTAARLSAEQAARLAVLLPAPKRYQRTLYSAYVNGRTAVIAARLADVPWPPP